MNVSKESSRRRTFAIISHPDAGKTTITEKLLLYANAIHLAGTVKSRKSSRTTVSDWMKMEQERGISISSSVLQFDYLGSRLNLLDTPGHADFSEDTYRTLAAVDSAVMLVDHSKGIESRTLKLFEVCRMRNLPIITFMNKLDREGLDPLELIDEISSTLNLKVCPINWPIGMGREFKGVVNIKTKEAILFEGDEGADKGSKILNAKKMPLDEAAEEIGAELYERTCEELELIEEAGDEYSHEKFLSGELSPIFWGSAMTNFGVEPLLNFLAENTASPSPRETLEGSMVQPNDETFTGFIFKIQANMNPRHRDRIAFVRVVSGKFERGMDTLIGRNKEKLRLSKPHSFMAQERAIVEEAWPGDIIGLYDPGKLRIGDTIGEKKPIQYKGIPRFAPEHFVKVLLEDPLKRKALDKGLQQLSHEGVIQLFNKPDVGTQDPYLGAVGILQFEVLKQRMQHEYNVNISYQTAPFTTARWVEGPDAVIEWFKARREYTLVVDRNKNYVLLTESPWPLQYALDNNPGLVLHDIEPL
ncbi:MAG: peptide chain release factor 3 [Deltaproteobacteria bacterium]|mgnify:CR=1 FL=1|nr:peptide chain release factor 3 [Deltaproteobacteria bacterium]MBU54834.1 peptide chain release factor 3 [Deltaproteobacteria bacterium]|tara:strand:+ start:1151 stop:2740 length:1590 start_codon:yes stop_codon:yes gene_type:complete